MNSKLRRILTLARHEYRAAARSRVLIALLTILVVVTAASVYVASADYRGKLADYQAYKSAALSGGVKQIAPSPLALLSLLTGAMEYIEIIGAVIAITLGYLSINRERVNRTAPLIRSRPVTAGELAAGSALGAVAVISTLILATTAAAVVCLGVIGNDWINGEQGLKLLLAYVASIVYMGTFYCLGVILTARSRVAVNGLLVALGIWLVVVLVVPQIGDTLDADNQIPGGLFAALTLNHDGEVTILTHFHAYEQVRTGIEASSLAKHYERFAFGMIDVKERYRGLTISQLLHRKWIDITWLVVYAAALGALLRRTLRNQPSIPTEGIS